MDLDSHLPPDVRERIEREIASDESPVGIDAKKTHVLILYRLLEIERRLAAIEARLGEAAAASGDEGPAG